jgi:ABC-2 type transport system permease protein
LITDSAAIRVARKELVLFFGSPVAWLFLAAFAALSLFIFFWVETWFARNVADVRPLFEWLPVLLIFLSAALTMRLWSEERRSGTLEHMLTQGVSLWQFVLGKFLACLALLMLALAATIPLPVTAALIADLDWGPVLAGYLASCLLGASYLSAGLFVSSLSDNPVVSLIAALLLCGTLYLIGSPLFTGFFTDETAQLMRALGSGSRFDSITRGVIDPADLAYYLSLTAGFLLLNIYTLERERWARDAATSRHRHWHTAVFLVLANLLAANILLDRLSPPRLDLTEGDLYSLASPTYETLDRLQEPLLIRGYFSARSHPLLAPLVPQLQDMLKEYQESGNGRVQVEFVDPAEEPDMEQEANERFKVQTTAFQVSDRHQATLINAYFSVVVQYGDKHQTLGFTDLIEVRTRSDGQAEVTLRNPEYEITRAIRTALASYRSGGEWFADIDGPLEFIAYISAGAKLPEPLINYRDAIREQAKHYVADSGGKLTMRFLEPEAMGGIVARQIEQEWGFTPVESTKDGDEGFFFYLTLADDKQVVQLPTGNFDSADFPSVFEAGLKRFSPDLTRTESLVTPPINEQMARHHLGAPTFINLERAIGKDYNLRLEQLDTGTVDPEADVLALVAPRQLNESALFAVDQFLMRGGTVIVATAPFTAEISGGKVSMRKWDSGLLPWLRHHGVDMMHSMVLDERNALFPAPVTRRSGDREFQDVRIVNYPYFLDLRDSQMARGHPLTANLPQLTMAWAAPLRLQRQENTRATPLLWSSPRAWTSDSTDVMPEWENGSLAAFPGEDSTRGKVDIGVLLEGRFDSYFWSRDAPPLSERESTAGSISRHGLLRRSSDSARLIVFSSNDFLDDQVLNTQVAATGTQYLGALELFLNTLDWATRDDQLLQLRSAGRFNRTLPPMENSAQALIEYVNYALAGLWLLFLAMVHWLLSRLRKRRYRRRLSL